VDAVRIVLKVPERHVALDHGVAKRRPTESGS